MVLSIAGSFACLSAIGQLQVYLTLIVTSPVVDGMPGIEGIELFFSLLNSNVRYKTN